MKHKLLWKILLLVGICPFAIPVALGVYRMSIESWTMSDWLVMYSFLFWPTYVIGFVLIVVSVCRLITGKKEQPN